MRVPRTRSPTEVSLCETSVIRRGETTDGAITLTVSGEIDLANATWIRRAFEAELDGPSVPSELDAELSGLRFMVSRLVG